MTVPSQASVRADGYDGCNPQYCEYGHEPHDHCACGLPMQVGQDLCTVCRHEGASFVPGATTYIEDEAWDGTSYPSRRAFREPRPFPEAYEQLLLATLAPDEWSPRRSLR